MQALPASLASTRTWLAFALVGSLAIHSCTSEQEQPSRRKSATIGHVVAIEGDAFIARGTERTPAVSGASLDLDDRLETGTPGKMRVELQDESVLAIGAGTTIALKELTLDDASRAGRLDLAAGRFWMNVKTWTGSGQSRWEIHTPNAVAGVRGTTLWGDTDVDAICALDGTIEVRSLRSPDVEPATLTAGKCTSKLSEGRLAPLEPTSEQIQEFLDEVLIRTK